METKLATQTQIDRANKVIAMGCKLSFEKILLAEMSKDLKKEWKPMSSKDLKAQKQRENVENSNFKCDDLGEYNRYNAMKNLPSSMR